MGKLTKYLPLAIGASTVLVLDLASKAWAQATFGHDDAPNIVLIPEHLRLTLTHNRGGAWGLFEDAAKAVRLSFFMIVSVIAVLFIVRLYGKLRPDQRALRWGLPFVLGGALGNAIDRVLRVGVVDFIDYRADWVGALNRGIAYVSHGWAQGDHWPTFNVADIAIVIGVGLMLIDSMSTRRRHPDGHGVR